MEKMMMRKGEITILNGVLVDARKQKTNEPIIGIIASIERKNQLLTCAFIKEGFRKRKAIIMKKRFNKTPTKTIVPYPSAILGPTESALFPSFVRVNFPYNTSSYVVKI